MNLFRLVYTLMTHLIGGISSFVRDHLLHPFLKRAPPHKVPDRASRVDGFEGLLIGLHVV